MAFTFVKSLLSGMSPVAPPADVREYDIDDSAGASIPMGTCMKFDATGELEPADGTDENAAVITLEGSAQDETVRAQWIKPGDVYKVPVTGTIGSLLVGVAYQITSNGVGVNQAQTDGPLTVLEVHEDDGYALVVFNSCAIALSDKSGT